MANRFITNRRRFAITIAIAAPIAIALGIGIGELHWRKYGSITIPEMRITADPSGETSITPGACDDPLPQT